MKVFQFTFSSLICFLPDFRYFVAENDEVKGETEGFIQQSAPNATKAKVLVEDDAVTVEEQRRGRRILKYACLAALSLLMAGATLVFSQRFPECLPSKEEEQE